MQINTFIERIQHLQQSKKLSHALLLEHGKHLNDIETAHSISQVILCQKQCLQNSTPTDQQCKTCQNMFKNQHPDNLSFKSDNKKITIDDCKQWLKWIHITPHEAQQKVLHVFDAHLMNKNAANALLKTLEEAPDFAFIFLWTSEKHHLLNTIVSRCLHVHIQTDAHKTDSQMNTHQSNISPEQASWHKAWLEQFKQKQHLDIAQFMQISKQYPKNGGLVHLCFDHMYQELKSEYEQHSMHIVHSARLDRFYEDLKTAEQHCLHHNGNVSLFLDRMALQWKDLCSKVSVQ